ncbi:MAG: polyprenyl synthetase family protein [Bacteroidales bacterium]|nr:polyprenyl synthetase family protein [Bacteroidales bacterium]
MHGFQTLQQYFNNVLEKETFTGEPSTLYAPIDYTLRLGGKRLRPVLCLASCELFGGTLSDALNAAIGIELFHNFTLLHDDIMDQAPMRRGNPSVHTKWNTNVAILSGDTMFAKAYEYIGKAEKEKLPEIHSVFTETAIEVCRGQQYDMNFEERTHVNEQEYIKMIRLKTAVLLGASLKIGGIIGAASEEDLRRIYEFGKNLGIAFQLKDDLLDAYADQEMFGKQTGNDIVTNKKTYLLIKAFELANERQKESLNYYFDRTKNWDEQEKLNAVLEIFNQLNIREETQKSVKKYQKAAIQSLDAINISEGRKGTLLAIVDYLDKREA